MTLNKEMRDRVLEVGFVLIFFTIAFTWAVLQPYNTAPDEAMRYLIPKFIYQHGRLPRGDDPAIRSNIWGISYGFLPYGAGIVSALFMKIISVFNNSARALLLAARMASVLWGVGTVILTIKTAKCLFQSASSRWLNIVLIGMLPQFVFLCTYVNNDSFAIFSTAVMLYAWVIGPKSQWDRRSRTILAIGVSACALSYYNAYGMILCSIIYYCGTSGLFTKDQAKRKKEIGKILYIIFLVALLAGWWFIRNLILYKGDLLGMQAEQVCAEMFAADKYKPSNRLTLQRQGMSLITMSLHTKWAADTYHSFVGVFGVMSIHMKEWVYDAYFLLFAVSAIGTMLKIGGMLLKKKIFSHRELLFHSMMIFAIILPVILSIYYSYTSDYQPQGRYIMPMLLPFMYYIVIGFTYVVNTFMKDEKKQNYAVAFLAVGIPFVTILVFATTVLPLYV